jgi:hypothetical protein
MPDSIADAARANRPALPDGLSAEDMLALYE